MKQPSVKDILSPVLDGLDERARTTIESRFGLRGEAKTFEEIGAELGVPRERIRQLERKTLQQLSASVRPALRDALDLEIAEMRASPIDEHGEIGRAHAPDRYQLPWTDLALTICEISTEDWLKACLGPHPDPAA